MKITSLLWLMTLINYLLNYDSLEPQSSLLGRILCQTKEKVDE